MFKDNGNSTEIAKSSSITGKAYTLLASDDGRFVWLPTKATAPKKLCQMAALAHCSSFTTSKSETCCYYAEYCR